MSEFELPKCGFVFWPVANGDSTTITLEPACVIQIDLHHLTKADDDCEPEWAVIDELVRLLPKKDSKPYLSVFALTHPDQDHIRGFSELLEKATIGEIWHTPKVFRDYDEAKSELCADAQAFCEEVQRRRDAIINSPTDVKAGDRVRIIGHDDILEEDDYKDIPREYVTVPGTQFSEIDGVDLTDSIEVFVHGPFKDDAEKERNDTSLSLHVCLKKNEKTGKALFFGDRAYPTVKQIFDKTIERDRVEYLQWDILLAPHHCSKKAMYWQGPDDPEECLKKDLMELLEKHQQANAAIVASSCSEFSDEAGDNPPHQKARKQYEKIVGAGRFLCTHEYPSKKKPEPITFELSDTDGLTLGTGSGSDGPTVASAVRSARGTSAPPQQQATFGSTD